jgi:hypothetical protein
MFMLAGAKELFEPARSTAGASSVGGGEPVARWAASSILVSTVSSTSYRVHTS